MDKRYQVFVSSTFKDLENERNAVFKTLMEMDCIPAGMELFPAIDEEQWEFIKKIIDDCDYYLLIIAGRYGTTTPEGKSYTEMEFDYAIEKGKRAVVLVHSDLESLPVSKSEPDPVARKKLEEFIDRAADGRLRKTWSNTDDLAGKVSISLQKTIKTYPAVGWVRADRIATEDSLNELIKAKEEIDTLRKTILEIRETQPSNFYGEDLANLEDHHTIQYMEFSKEDFTITRNNKISINLGMIYDKIAPKADEGCSESSIGIEVSNIIYSLLDNNSINVTAFSDDIITLRMHFIALGLIEYYNSWWSLTDKGKDQMLRRRIIRKPPQL
ncbi:DUF4062 domain-containing protein [Pantoea sp. YR343]|uniref:DUF4062 domain-containing protein n=1 Tax=Pantoea sp. YR343 TaxID=1144341 RepID=UPI000270EFC8|nr:DUF4062 domain-containing protein [Pantoea sp. YR343]KAJ9432430.1 DUF4062 domain-containing protein [Pantoea sp. YR343]